MTGAWRAIAIAAALLAAPPALAAKRALGPGERIDLNRASVAELMRLPGLGQKRAQAIAAARARQPFRRVEDVVAVKGIGPGWLARVRSSLIASGAAPPAPVLPPGQR